MQRGFTKLFSTIVTSTIWSEDDKTRIVWITMLAIADANGIVSASIPGLAAVARVDLPSAEKALGHLHDKDKYSRTKDNDGRRIETIDGGWRILNYAKYRRMLNEEERREYKARWIKDKRKSTTVYSRQSRRKSTQADAEAEAKKKEGANGSRPPVSVEDWLKELEADPTYKGVAVRIEYGKMLNWCKVRKKHPTQRRFINWLNNAERTLPANHAAKVTYKRNYTPQPEPELSDDEREELREQARQETEALRLKLKTVSPTKNDSAFEGGNQ